MKFLVAIVLVVATVASAEPPFGGQQQAPYQPKGFRPGGAAFNSRQQQLPPAPAASYGPPGTTTELPTTTTETVEATTLEPQQQTPAISQKLTEGNQINPASLYVVVPQTQNLLYATSAKLVQQRRLVPVQAVPALAKIQEVPQFAQVVQYQAVVAPVVTSAYTSIVNTPFSSTYVQSIQ